ncbi:hypothetical protein Dimus_001850 [Dionaea muscipula]
MKNDSFTLVIFFFELLNSKWTTSFIWWQNSLFLCIVEHQLLKKRMAALLMNISNILDLLQRIANSGDEAYDLVISYLLHMAASMDESDQMLGAPYSADV